MTTPHRPVAPEAAVDPVTDPAAHDPGVGWGRSLAPDIARGLLLMFIAVANVPLFHRGLTGDVRRPGIVDQVVSAFDAVFVTNRSRPMFAILFGFGIAMMAARAGARGVDERGIHRVLRRRSLWLMLFGLVHSVLLFSGDILAAYGVTGLLTLWFVHRSNRVLRGWFWGALLYSTLVLGAAGPSLTGHSGAPGDASSGGVTAGLPWWRGEATTYPQAMLQGLGSSLGSQALTVLVPMFVPLVILGFWLFRSQWLTRPEEHVPQLRRVFAVTMTVNLLVSSASLSGQWGLWSPSGAVRVALGLLEILAANGAGAGYVCGFALLAVRWAGHGRRGLPGVLAAVGERSLTAYLLQSVVFFAVVTGWGLGLGARLGAAGDAAVAVTGWGLIAVAMAVLARFGLRGPFEVLIRRLTYRPRRAPQGRHRTTTSADRATSYGPASCQQRPLAPGAAGPPPGAVSAPLAVPLPASSARPARDR